MWRFGTTSSKSQKFVLFSIQVLIYSGTKVKSVPARGRSNIIFKGDSGQSLGQMATRRTRLSIVQDFPAFTVLSPVCLEKCEGWEKRSGKEGLIPLAIQKPLGMGSTEVRRGTGKTSNLLDGPGVEMGKKKRQFQQLSNHFHKNFREETWSFPYPRSRHREREIWTQSKSDGDWPKSLATAYTLTALSEKQIPYRVSFMKIPREWIMGMTSWKKSYYEGPSIRAEKRRLYVVFSTQS